MGYSDRLPSIQLEVNLCCADCCCGKRCNPVTEGIDDTRRFGSKRALQLPLLALLFPSLNASHPNGMFVMIDLKESILHRFGRNGTFHVCSTHVMSAHATVQSPPSSDQRALRSPTGSTTSGPVIRQPAASRPPSRPRSHIPGPCCARLRSVDRAAMLHGRMFSAGWARRHGVLVGLAPSSNDLQCRPRSHACHFYMSLFKSPSGMGILVHIVVVTSLHV